jgi:hypothetical protein
MSKPISQREARRLRKTVRKMEADLAAQRSRWTKEWPGGVLIDTIEVSNTEWNIVRTARLMGHPVVVTAAEVNKLGVWGIKQ